MTPELFELSDEFVRLESWISSPLYRVLGPVVASQADMLDVVSHRRAGQIPASIFFAAVHRAVFHHPKEALAEFYPTVVGATWARPASEAVTPFLEFFAKYHDEIDELVRARLVQKQVIKRAALLRMGLFATKQHLGQTPLHLVEIGASAGAHLRFERFGYDIGGKFFGDRTSPVTITTQWRSNGAVPDLDDVPTIASVTGIDLRPIDATNDDDCLWLRSLVWPEEVAEATLLEQTLELVAQDPPLVLAGDVVDIAPDLAATMPAGQPRLVFHFGTRIHVSEERLSAFDAAVQKFGDSGPLYVLSFEHAEPPFANSVLSLRVPDEADPRFLVLADGYANWVARFSL
jgi:hypothetical protein